MDETLALGDHAMDKITEMEGTITAAASYLHGQDRLELTCLDKAGRPIELWGPVDRFAPVFTISVAPEEVS